MKLKKIASLMLAGIMAVSMLAGCKSGSSNTDTEVENPEVPVSSNAVTYANDALSGNKKELFSFSNDDTVNTALRAVATDSNSYTSADIKWDYDTYKSTFNARTALGEKLSGKLSGERTANGLDFGNVPADKVSQKAIYVYTVSGALDEKAAVETVVSAIAGGMTRTNYPASVQAGSTTYDCDYSANISAVKVSAPDDSTKTAWVIGVVFTQTVAESV